MPDITEPSYEVAQAAYQTLMELVRRHPKDKGLVQAYVAADRLLEHLWKKHHGERQA